MAETTTKKHPIRGAIWGVPMGLGLALILAGQGVIAFGDTTPFVIVVIIGMLISIVWSMFGPAKAPKTPMPDTDKPAELLDPEPMADSAPSAFAVEEEPATAESERPTDEIPPASEPPVPTEDPNPDEDPAAEDPKPTAEPTTEPEETAEPTEPEDPDSVQI